MPDDTKPTKKKVSILNEAAPPTFGIEIVTFGDRAAFLKVVPLQGPIIERTWTVSWEREGEGPWTKTFRKSLFEGPVYFDIPGGDDTDSIERVTVRIGTNERVIANPGEYVIAQRNALMLEGVPREVTTRSDQLIREVRILGERVSSLAGELRLERREAILAARKGEPADSLTQRVRIAGRVLWKGSPS